MEESARHLVLHPSDVLRQNIERISAIRRQFGTVFYLIEGQQILDKLPRATLRLCDNSTRN